MTAAELFAFADAARDRGDFEVAEKAYRALALDSSLELRSEARFRLGMMLADKRNKFREAAIEFRKILDENPEAAGVRLQLARMHAQLGNFSSARRELRAAQSSGLPPEVDRMVRFYANALESRKRSGGSLELAIAPSTNINRATSENTLGTVIGEFQLNDNARAQSGVGLSLRGQTYIRPQVAEKTDLLMRLSGSADIYRKSQFDDLLLQAEAGPQFRLGEDRLSLSAIVSHRWYGLDPYTRSFGASASYRHPLGKRGQMRLDSQVLRTDNLVSDLQDSTRFVASAAVDRAFSARFGGGLEFTGVRDGARDPGYATASGGGSAYLYREIGATTAAVTLSYQHLEADKRLFIYPERRRDDRFAASLSGTFRGLAVGTLAPLVRLKYERNRSTIEIYDFTRAAAELGVVAAF